MNIETEVQEERRGVQLTLEAHVPVNYFVVPSFRGINIIEQPGLLVSGKINTILLK